MTAIREALASLQREVEAALNERRSTPAGVRLEADAVTVSVGMVFEAGHPSGNGASAGRFRIATGPATGLPQHSLTFHFRAVSPEPPDFRGTPSVLAGPSHAPEQRRLSVEAKCREVFGPPGFDNSARAEVFSELAAGRTSEELSAALAAVAADTPGPAVGPGAGIVFRLRRLLGFAPAGPAAAATVLRRLLDEVPLAEVLSVLAERWRFGPHWSQPGETEKG